MDDDRLIEYVSKCPELFDMRHRKYKDNVWKTQVWFDISRKLGKDAEKCRVRWESLRSQFRKYLRSVKKTSIQDETYFSKQFKYADQLEFLRPHIRVKRIVSDGEGGTPEVFVSAVKTDPHPTDTTGRALKNETCENTRPETPTTSSRICRKRPHSSTFDNFNETASSSIASVDFESAKRNHERIDDEIDHFFASMKGSFRKFSEMEQLQAKRQIFSIITTIETKRCEQKFRISKHSKNSYPYNSTGKRENHQESFTSNTMTFDDCSHSFSGSVGSSGESIV